MHVAVVVAEFPKVSETFILDHVAGLRRRGHRVTVVADRPKDPGPMHPAWSEFGMDQLTAYRPPRSERTEAISTVAREVARSPYRARRLLQPSSSSGSDRTALIREIVVDSRLSDVDVFHCHYGPIGLRQVDALEVLERSTPVVTTFHGFDVTKYIDQFGPVIYDRLFRGGSLFLPVSELFRNRLLELGAPADRTIVHHMGVDVNRFPNTIEREHVGPMRAVMIGRLVEKKGMEWAIRAVGQARDSGSHIDLTIVGGGPLRAQLETLAQDVGVPVDFTGSLSGSEVSEFLLRSDVLIAPSVTAQDGDMEGIPVVVMEAMSASLPVVATVHSGIPELVSDGATGLLSPERDSASLASHLQALQDPALRAQLGASGRKRVEASFNRDVLDDELAQLYASVIR